MEQPVPVDVLVRPWRTATLVASAVAAVELVIILAERQRRPRRRAQVRR